ncbi:MAG TPA: serine/threonine-protein kinase [Polyangiaceae bacterium]
MPRDTAKLRVASLKPWRKSLGYRPILALGAGGMGEVTLAVKKGGLDVKKLVVLKTLRRDMLGDESIRRLFLEEASLSARLSHPNVVQVFNVIANGNPILVMEYLDGKPLSAILHRAGNRCSIAMQLQFLSHVLAGLHYSHELCDYDGTPLKIVHRDVSPQNVFVTYDGQVKVLDFGLAKVAIKRSRTKSGTVKGKLEYMPVEQMIGGDVDRRADIYAVGCMLWHACAGERLWANESETTIVRNLITGNIPRPSTRRRVDVRLEAMTMKALAFDPKHRYQTALAFQEDIDDFLREISNVPSSHDISKFVSDLFAQEREVMASVIRTAMTTPSLQTPALHAVDVDEPSLLSWFKRRLSLGRSTKIATIAAASVVIGIVAIRLLHGRAGPVTMDGAVDTPRLVTLRIAAAPSGAVLTVDNRPTEQNPASLRLPADNRQHEVRAALSGYETVSRFVRLERDLSLLLALQPTATVASAAPASSNAPTSGGKATTRRKKTNTTGGADVSCDPPHYYKDGLKYFKRHCL